jgi:mannose PTS system EIIAB component
MPLVLVRIDDRLIHRQVVIGWWNVLLPQHIILCSDEVAGSDWQRSIYQSAVPDEIDASVMTIGETVEFLQLNPNGDERILLLVDNPKSVVELVDAGIQITQVNVGGMHFRPGKNQIAPFIFVDQADIDYFQLLHQKGIVLEGRDVPNCIPIDIVDKMKLDR